MDKTISINAMDDEGRGHGTSTVNGRAYEVAVRGGFTGDSLTMTPERTFEGRGLVVGRINQFKRKGDCHSTASCPHRYPCPSCPLHDATPTLAKEIKQGRILAALKDLGLDKMLEDLESQPNPLGYRQRTKWVVGGDTSRPILGHYIPYSHRLVPAHLCPHNHPDITQAAIKILACLEPNDIKALLCRLTVEGVSAIFVCKKAMAEQQWARFKALVDSHDLAGIRERIDPSESNSLLGGEIGREYGQHWLTQIEGGAHVDPDVFCQTDPVQATRMYKTVAEYLSAGNLDALFVDAYAGVGGFSHALQQRGVRRIVAIESAPLCTRSLAELNIETHACTMEEALPILEKQGPIAGMILDPPRKGLGALAEPLVKLGAQKVVLVSCDPKAMARDLKAFVDSYTVERILPLDLFSGTPDVETLVFLNRRLSETI